MSYVYIRSEVGVPGGVGSLWTVGFYRPDGKFIPESDHHDCEEAAKRVAWLNGASDGQTQEQYDALIAGWKRLINELRASQ